MKLASQKKRLFPFKGAPRFKENIFTILISLILFTLIFYQVQNNKLDLDEYFNDNCILIEWPLENLIKRYNHMALSINISVTGEKRNIEIKSNNKKWLHKIK